MELKANLLKLANEWIIAQVEPVEGDTLPGDPDVWMLEPYVVDCDCLLYTSPSPRDATLSRMPSSA